MGYSSYFHWPITITTSPFLFVPWADLTVCLFPAAPSLWPDSWPLICPCTTDDSAAEPPPTPEKVTNFQAFISHLSPLFKVIYFIKIESQLIKTLLSLPLSLSIDHSIYISICISIYPSINLIEYHINAVPCLGKYYRTKPINIICSFYVLLHKLRTIVIADSLLTWFRIGFCPPIHIYYILKGGDHTLWNTNGLIKSYLRNLMTPCPK